MFEAAGDEGTGARGEQEKCGRGKGELRSRSKPDGDCQARTLGRVPGSPRIACRRVQRSRAIITMVGAALPALEEAAGTHGRNQNCAEVTPPANMLMGELSAQDTKTPRWHWQGKTRRYRPYVLHKDVRDDGDP